MSSWTRFLVAPLCAALALVVAVRDDARAQLGSPQLSVSETLAGNAKLTWVLPTVTSGPGLEVERRPAGGAWTQIRRVKRPLQQGSRVDRHPLAGPAGYRVRMVIGNVNYPWSAEVAFQPTVPVDCP